MISTGSYKDVKEFTEMSISLQILEVLKAINEIKTELKRMNAEKVAKVIPNNWSMDMIKALMSKVSENYERC